MTERIIIAVVGALAGLIAANVFRLLGQYIHKRVTIMSPDSALIRKMLVIVRSTSDMQDALMDVQIRQTKALTALLEATKGQINGNVDEALSIVRGADAQFNAFLRSRAKPDMPEEEAS